MTDFKSVSYKSGGYTGGTGGMVDKDFYVGYIDNKVAHGDKCLKDMSLIEAKEYYSKN